MSHTESRSSLTSGYPGCRVPLRPGSELGHGEAVRDRIIGSEWPAGSHRGITWALAGLIDALETYRLAHGHATRPAMATLEPQHSNDPWHRAMSMAAHDASAWAAELDRLVPVTSVRAA